ncbi:MAG: class II aldolase/adducin family protein [Geminicoccaceae bacterium]
MQAGGGNTSLKLDGTLWVKASGFWLADATKSDLFVPVDTARVLDAIDGGDEGDVRAATIADKNPAGLRPSIETSLHALLPHRFVVHTHSVRTIAIAIRKDAEARFAERLQGLSWAFVPYVFPGLPLTRAIRDAIDSRPIDVIVMGNHGLVVAADDLGAAAALLAEVERRLDAPTLKLDQPPRRRGQACAPSATPRRTPWRTTRACASRPPPAPTTPTMSSSSAPPPPRRKPAARASTCSSCRAKAPICPWTPSPPPTSWPSASLWSSPACPRGPS